MVHFVQHVSGMKKDTIPLLDSWMIRHNKTSEDLASAIGRNKARAHRIRKGCLPNEEEAPLIELWTGGAIQQGDFYERVSIRSIEGSRRNNRRSNAASEGTKAINLSP